MTHTPLATNWYDVTRNDTLQAFEIIDTRSGKRVELVSYADGSAVVAQAAAQANADAHWFNDLIRAQIDNAPDAIEVEYSEALDCALIAAAGGPGKNPYRLRNDLSGGYTMIDTRTGRYVAWKSRDDIYDPRYTSLCTRIAWLQELRIQYTLRRAGDDNAALTIAPTPSPISPLTGGAIFDVQRRALFGYSGTVQGLRELVAGVTA